MMSLQSTPTCHIYCNINMLNGNSSNHTLPGWVITEIGVRILAAQRLTLLKAGNAAPCRRSLSITCFQSTPAAPCSCKVQSGDYAYILHQHHPQRYQAPLICHRFLILLKTAKQSFAVFNSFLNISLRLSSPKEATRWRNAGHRALPHFPSGSPACAGRTKAAGAAAGEAVPLGASVAPVPPPCRAPPPRAGGRRSSAAGAGAPLSSAEPPAPAGTARTPGQGARNEPDTPTLSARRGLPGGGRCCKTATSDTSLQ